MFNLNILEDIRHLLISRGETVAVTESVTAGHVQAALSLPKEASFYFQGGITAYNLGQKARHLNIDAGHAKACNCVSEETTCEMAAHVCDRFLSH
jgi:nicotinamide-nucleotide amidase